MGMVMKRVASALTVSFCAVPLSGLAAAGIVVFTNAFGLINWPLD